MMQQNSIVEVHSKIRIILMNVTIQIGSLNIGYVLTYLTLSIDTLFANLNITKDEKTQTLSLLNGILPLGCFVGAIGAYFLQQRYSNKICLRIADIIGTLSIITIVSNTSVIMVFRFLLGVSNGMQSFIMPVYMKSLCPDKYYVQLSMILGYGANTGLMVGHLMGIGYISYNGSTSNWWRVVFVIPALICLLRLILLKIFFDLDSPEQLINSGKLEQAKSVISYIYKEEYCEQMFQKYQQIATQMTKHKMNFFHIFEKQHFIPFQIGLISMLTQIWSGSFAVFYYSAQIFEELSGGELVTKTIYTLCLGVFSSAAQTGTMYLVKQLGSKYLLMAGAFLMGSFNIIIAILANNPTTQTLFIIFIFMVLLLMVYAVSIGPIGWSIIPQLNDSAGTFLIMDIRWAIQTILVFLFPFMVRGIQIQGCFILFGVLDIFYTFYAYLSIVDSRGKSNSELMQCYLTKYKILPTEIEN